MISQRCMLQILKCEVNEFCTEEYETIAFVQNTIDKLCNNEQIKKIFELVLFVAVYLSNNFKKKNSKKYMVFELDTLLQLETFKSGNSDSTLFAYFVECVNQKYPELAHWVNAFDELHKFKRISLMAIEKQIAFKQKQIDAMQQLLDGIPKEKSTSSGSGTCLSPVYQRPKDDP